jgi:hypothetical protein
MKTFNVKVVVIVLALSFFMWIPHHTCDAAKVEGVEGNSYLTFLISTFNLYLDIISFKEGTFSMALLEEQIGGSGEYTDREVLYTAEWTSTDGNTKYNFTGISIVSLVTFGIGEKTVPSGNATDTDQFNFVGILSTLIPD